MALGTWKVVTALAVVALAACKSDEKESGILPINATFSVMPVATDPVVFLQANQSTSHPVDVVLIDVMLRDGSAQPFDAFTLEVRFDPGVLQIGEVDDTATPLGNCRGSGACDPLCINNVQPANTTGDLLIGVATKAGCAGYSGGSVRLLTLGVIASTVGTSPIELVDGPGRGDCEILSSLAALPITCDDDDASVVGSR